MVAFEAKKDGRILIGHAARNQCDKNWENTIFDAKRMIGRNFDDPVVQEDMKRYPFKLIAGKDDDENKPTFVVKHQQVEK